jgi:BASS family bile acid:Na+ symporter
MLVNLASFTLVPLAIGMLVRARASALAARAVEPIRKAVLYLMAIVLVLGVASSFQQLVDHLATAGALVVTMNVLTMGLGYGLARMFSLPLAQAVTITFEVGVQNLALSFAITFNMLNRPDLAVAGLLYAAVMPATALAFVSIARRLMAADAQSSAGVMVDTTRAG